MADIPLPAPLWRRLVAGIYDGLLLAGLFLIAGWILVVSASLSGLELDRLISQLVYFSIGGLYFGLCWSTGGQTLGMKAWRLVLRRDDGAPLRLPIALLRYAGAWVSLMALGLGFLWSMIDARRRAWHDLLAGTEMIQLPRG